MNPQQTLKNFVLKWLPLCLACMALFIIVLDATLLNVALPVLVKDFNTTIQSLQWVISGYSLLLASLLITGGRLGDLYGRKKIFLIGAVIFAIGSFVTSISQTLPILLIGEAIIEGIGAALMVPATAVIIVSSFQGRDRAVAFGIWAAFASVAASLGPLVGGFLTTNYSWRWGFRINILIVLILLVFSFVIKDSKETNKRPKLDIVGVLLSALGLFSVTFGIIEASTYGWLYAKQAFTLLAPLGLTFDRISICPVAFLLGVLLIAAFTWWEKKVTESGEIPLVSLSIFKNKPFVAGLILILFVYIGFIGVSFLIPTFLQAVTGVSAFVAGLTLAAYSASHLVFSQISVYLSKKIRPRYLIQIGLVIAAAGILVLRNAIHAQSGPADLIFGLIIFGIGTGSIFAHLINNVMSAVPISLAGEASGIYNTVTQIGIAFGVAVTGAVFVSMILAGLYSGVDASGMIQPGDKQYIAELIPSQVSNIEFGNVAALQAQIPDRAQYAIPEINSISKLSITSATRHALLYSLGFIVLALVAAGI